MADKCATPVEQPVFFNLFGNNDPHTASFFAEEMSYDEKEEIAILFSQVEGVNSKELIDFATQETGGRHLTVSESELDRMASKNNAETTNYQTKWAVTVLRGKKNSFSFKLIHNLMLFKTKT